MAHFAQLDGNNVVKTVIVVNNDVVDNLPFPESEPIGIQFCQSLYGTDTVWRQTSYNASFRYNYAGIDFTFDGSASPNGAFIPPYPGPGWHLDTNTYTWVPDTQVNEPPTVI
jgi:hypothetical protein